MANDFDDNFFAIDILLMEEEIYWNSVHETATATPTQEQTEAHMQQVQQPKGRKQLTVHQKRQLVDAFLHNLVGKELPRGFQSSQAKKFNVHKSTILRLHREVLRQMEFGNVIDVRSKKLGRTGPKPFIFTDQMLQSVPLCKKTTCRSYAAALNVSHGTIQKILEVDKNLVAQSVDYLNNVFIDTAQFQAEDTMMEVDAD
ncbi:unnamed protein product [Amaranthus hypochondriacus]